MFAAKVELFCAALGENVTKPTSPLIVNQLTAQRGQGFSLSTGYFTAQVSGTYVVHLSSGLFTGTPTGLIIILVESIKDVALTRTSTSHNGWDTVSRDFITTLSRGKNIYLDLYKGLSASNSMKQTSWSVFLLDNLMSPLITFCVALSTSTNVATGIVNFPFISVNVGNGWNNSTNTFTAPRNGTYVFSLSVGLQSGKSYYVYVEVGSSDAYELISTSNARNGTDTASRTFALSLTSGDTVYVSISTPTKLISDVGSETSFAGFLYEPLNGLKVIWSVHQTSFYMRGPYNPFPFNSVSVNVGNGWKVANNTFIVPYAGVYQLHLTCTTDTNGTVDYRLMWNGLAYASIYSNTTKNNGMDTKSRAIMIEAAVGDTFHVSTSPTTNLRSDLYKLISFTGFLLSL